MTHSTTVDGVPVRWTEQPGRWTANLVFRVGARDETYATAGLTHLVEHLALAGFPEADHEVNGEVGLNVTEFTFEGAPDEVAATIEALCRALARLAQNGCTEADLARERAILEAEGTTSAVPPQLGEALTNHYGLAGPGLGAVDEAFLDRLAAEDVARHARDYFTRGNAVLVCSGPPPESLRLPLPEGRRRTVEPGVPVLRRGPVEYISGGTNLVLSFQVPGTEHDSSYALPVLLRALERRVHTGLRRTEGLVYGLEGMSAFIDAGRDLVCAVVDVAPKNAALVARRVVDELRNLRDEGLTDEELRAASTRLASDRAEPGAPSAETYEEALSELTGTRTWRLEDFTRGLETYSQADLADLLSLMEQTLMVGLPDAAVPEDADPETGVVFPARKPSTVPDIEGTLYKRALLGRFAGAPSDTRLVVGEGGLDLTMAGARIAARWEDIVGLEIDQTLEGVQGFTLYTREAFQMAIMDVWFRKGKEAFERILEHVPERLRFEASAEESLAG